MSPHWQLPLSHFCIPRVYKDLVVSFLKPLLFPRAMGSGKFVIGGLAGIAAIMALAGSAKHPSLSGPQAKLIPSQQKDDDVTITLSGSQSDGLVSRVSVQLGARMQVFLSDYVPVSFAVPSIKYETPLPVEQGLMGFNVSFPRPYNIDGAQFVIYGHHPATRERKVLFEDVFHFEKQRWY